MFMHFIAIQTDIFTKCSTYGAQFFLLMMMFYQVTTTAKEMSEPGWFSLQFSHDVA